MMRKLLLNFTLTAFISTLSLFANANEKIENIVISIDYKDDYGARRLAAGFSTLIFAVVLLVSVIVVSFPSFFPLPGHYCPRTLLYIGPRTILKHRHFFMKTGILKVF